MTKRQTLPESAGIQRADYATRFQPGNPGRKPGTRDVRSLLDEALKRAAKTRTRLQEPCACVSFLITDRAEAWALSCQDIDEHFARQAYRKHEVLVAFQKKRIPDLQHQTGAAAPTQINIVLGHRKVLIAQPEPANA